MNEAIKVKKVTRAAAAHDKRSFEEQAYLPEILKGLKVTAKHFLVNMWMHLSHLVGIKPKMGLGHLSVCRRTASAIAAFAHPAPAGQARERGTSLRGLHDVRNDLSGQMHLYRGGRSSGSEYRKSMRCVLTSTSGFAFFAVFALRPVRKMPSVWTPGSWRIPHIRVKL